MRNLSAAIAVSLALVGTGWASTKYNSTWKNPDAKPVTFQGKKVVALIVSSEESTRRGAEDELSRQLTRRGVQGVSAYTILTGDVKDKESAKAAFEKAGAAGVVVMRVLGSEQEFNSSGGGVWYTGPSYGSFWGGYWGMGWSAVYSPGYLRTETVVTVETLVYSLEQDKLLWGGRSQTTNPSRVDALIKTLAGKAASEMKKGGLLSPAAR